MSRICKVMVYYILCGYSTNSDNTSKVKSQGIHNSQAPAPWNWLGARLIEPLEPGMDPALLSTSSAVDRSSEFLCIVVMIITAKSYKLPGAETCQHSSLSFHFHISRKTTPFPVVDVGVAAKACRPRVPARNGEAFASQPFLCADSAKTTVHLQWEMPPVYHSCVTYLGNIKIKRVFIFQTTREAAQVKGHSWHFSVKS